MTRSLPTFMQVSSHLQVDLADHSVRLIISQCWLLSTSIKCSKSTSVHSYWSIGVFSWEFVRKFRVNRARFRHFQKRLTTVTFISSLNKLLLLKFFSEGILYFLNTPVFFCQIYEDSSRYRFIHIVQALSISFNLALIFTTRNLISLCVIRCATWSVSRKYYRLVCVLRKCISIMK